MGLQSIHHHHCTLNKRADGYAYSHNPTNSAQSQKEAARAGARKACSAIPPRTEVRGFSRKNQMKNATGFIADALQLDSLPDSFTQEQVLSVVAQALQHSVDARSDVDENRITALRQALRDIELTTKDAIVALTAKRALVADDE